jgi:precorrin-6B methylase 2
VIDILNQQYTASMPRHTTAARRGLGAAFLLVGIALFVAIPAVAQPPNDTADAARIAELLALHNGSVVADIGAGTGPLTIAIAPYVGPTGRVYSTDLEPARLAEIQKAADDAGLHTVTVLRGDASQTNLPAGSCDGIFMRDVYHHFADPPAMNASLLASLKPGGRLIVSDFNPRSGRTAAAGKRDQGADHGILAVDVIKELTAAGFADVREASPWPSTGYFAIVASRPAR